METLRPGMVKTIYDRVKNHMYQMRASTINRWMIIKFLVQEGYDQYEVEESLDLLQYEASLIFEPHVGQLALVK